MIQDRLKVFREKIENELANYSLSSKADWLNELNKNECTIKHIRTLYLVWLYLIIEEMEKDPKYACANTIEGFMRLNCHNVSIEEIYKMVCDCFTCDGLFKNSQYKYEDVAQTIVIAKPVQGLRNANKSLYDRGELLGFPWYFFFQGWSLKDIAGLIKMICEEYLFVVRFSNKHHLIDELRECINVTKATSIPLSNGLNPQMHKDWLKKFCSNGSANQYTIWLDVNRHPELIPLLNKHGIKNNNNDIYSCIDLIQLYRLFEELADNKTTDARQANKHSNMISAVRWFIIHLLLDSGAAHPTLCYLPDPTLHLLAKRCAAKGKT